MSTNNGFNCLVLIFVILLISFRIKESFVEINLVKSDVDGNDYLVQRNGNQKETANLLANINKKLLDLIAILETKYPSDERTLLVKQNYDPSSISEGTGESKFTSYSINKGEKIVFCLKMRDGSGNLVNENTLTYVAIHELAHLATKEIGHENNPFWDNFKWLLSIAADNGIYQYVDYEKNPEPYCGLIIKSNILNR